MTSISISISPINTPIPSTPLSATKWRVTIKSSSMVKPAEPTWSGRLPLSELDQTGTTTHVPTIYFYKKPSDPWDTILPTLLTSLTTTLVHFYPLAGRLASIAGGRLELDCNAAGVHFAKAYAEAKLVDLDDFMESPLFHHLIPSVDYRHTPLEETPLLLLQVTRFGCGGWSLGFCISHLVVDGQSALHFLSEWARVCRGETVVSPPYLDNKVLRAGEPLATTCLTNHVPFTPPPFLIGQTNNKNERRKETSVAMLKVPKSIVKKLRNKDNESKMDRGFTRYEAVTAHTWRTACKVRNHKPEQPTAVGICVDVRGKMKPPLPEKYFGNAVVDVIATGTSGEIVSKPLGYVSNKIKETIEKVNHDYVNSMIDFLKSRQDLSKFHMDFLDDEGLFYGNPNLGVISWLTLPTRGMDFGWGKELFTGPGSEDVVNGVFLILGREEGGGSLVVALCLQVKHMEDFKRVFYQTIED